MTKAGQDDLTPPTVQTVHTHDGGALPSGAGLQLFRKKVFTFP